MHSLVRGSPNMTVFKLRILWVVSALAAVGAAVP